MPDEAREGFMFFRSYYEGAKELDDEQRLAFYDALIEYALNDTEPTISGVPKSCFAFVKPVLDRSKARAEAGRKGGKSKREANSKQKFFVWTKSIAHYTSCRSLVGSARL